MPTTLTKKELNDILVAERKKGREKAKKSKFVSRTLSIYKNQVARAKELGKEVFYTLIEFRDRVSMDLEIGECYYCKGKINEKNFVGDHKDPISRTGLFTLENLAICDKSCNCQKGKMNDKEFEQLNQLLKTFDPDIAKDVRARLTTGGRWMPH